MDDIDHSVEEVETAIASIKRIEIDASVQLDFHGRLVSSPLGSLGKQGAPEIDSPSQRGCRVPVAELRGIRIKSAWIGLCIQDFRLQQLLIVLGNVDRDGLIGNRFGARDGFAERVIFEDLDRADALPPVDLGRAFREEYPSADVSSLSVSWTSS